MTVLPQGEHELLKAHKRLRHRRSRRLLGLPSRISSLTPTSWADRRRARCRRSSRRVPRITAGAVAIVASVLVVFGVAAVFLVTARKPPAPTRPSSSKGQHVGENRIDHALTNNFKLLRRPVRSSDRLPTGLAQIATPSAPLNGDSSRSSLGLTPRLAREVTLPGTGLRAWLIPGRRGVCWDAEYASRELGVSCSSSQHLATALAATNSYDSVKTRTGLLTIGLVTDRVHGLELVKPNRRPTRIPISDGFYAGYGISGRKLIALTAKGAETLPRASSEIVLNTDASPTAIAPTPRQRETLLTQLNLRSPAGDRQPKGIAQIYKSAHGRLLSLKLSGVSPAGSNDAYAVWLYSTPRAARLLGFINQHRDHAGTLTTSGALPSDASRYRQLLVTLETQPRPKTPGKPILIGPLHLGG